jgi:hypothetical protein
MQTIQMKQKTYTLGTTFIKRLGHFVKEWINVKGRIESTEIQVSCVSKMTKKRPQEQ